MVQSVFLKLWSERATLFIETLLKSYLLKSVRNACPDEIRHRNGVQEHESYVASYGLSEDSTDTDRYILYPALSISSIIRNACGKLLSLMRTRTPADITG
jgi:RNA polymerase sigma-70 factor (ECF subfamily)